MVLTEYISTLYCVKYARIRVFYIFLYEEGIADSVLLRDNTGQIKSLFWHILRSVECGLDLSLYFAKQSF